MKNKYLALTLASALLFNTTVLPVSAAETPTVRGEIQGIAKTLPLSEEVIPAQLEKELKEEIKKVYGKKELKRYTHTYSK